MIQARLERGRIDVAVQLGPAPGQSTQQIRVDAALAAQYVAAGARRWAAPWDSATT